MKDILFYEYVTSIYTPSKVRFDIEKPSMLRIYFMILLKK